MKVCRNHLAKISMRTKRKEFTLIPKGHPYIDFLVEKHPMKESTHVIEVIRGKYAEADAR